MPVGFMEGGGALQGPPAGNQINNQDDDGDNEQQMDEPAADVADKTEEPENQENNKNSPEHKFPLVEFILLRLPRRGCAYGIFANASEIRRILRKWNK